MLTAPPTTFKRKNRRKLTNRERNKYKGFTIIEVVLVLAIAGLIFLMIFVALPALQRSVRNNQRKKDAQRVYAAIMEYYGNNNKLPLTSSKTEKKNVYDWYIDKNFVPRYVDSNCEFENEKLLTGGQRLTYSDCGSEFTSPSGRAYTLCTHRQHTGSYTSYGGYIGCIPISNEGQLTEEIIQILPYRSCDTYSYLRNKNLLPNTFSVTIWLEGGEEYCIDNV